MSDNTDPPKPPKKGLSHLHSEPVPISFASPQQIAQFTSGTASFFNAFQPNQPYRASGPSMSSGYNMNYTPVKTQPIQPTSTHSTSTAAAAAADATASATTSTPQSASSGPKVLKPLPPQAIDLNNFKGLKFVTLDGLQIETRDVYDKISGTFKWEMCESQEERCVNHIRDECTNKRVFLVSSGSLGAKTVPQIHELPQVYAIYIYCANVKYHEEWAKKFAKVRVVCDNDDLHLLPQFAVDVAQANIDWANALLKQGNREKAKEKFQLAFDKLNNYARNHDQAMDVEIQTKLEECK